MQSAIISVRRSFQVAGAFFRLGLQQELSYPLGFVTGQFSAMMPVFIFFFISRQFDQPNYFAFVLVGLLASRFMDTGVRGFSTEIDIAINRGWLEMFLVEPVHWRMLPISMVQWRAVQGIVNALLMAAVGIFLGAQFRTDQLLTALLIVVLGLLAGLAIGTLSASLKVLAKQGDPILFIYGLLVQVFSGVFFPVEQLPVFIRWISWLIPHTYAIAALRNVLMPDQTDLTSMSSSTALIALTGFCVVLFPLSLWLYGRALEYGRKLGVLSGY